MLSLENKARRRDTDMSLLYRFKNREFLRKIVTYDEKWILYETPNKRKSWFYSGEPLASTAKLNLQAKKGFLCVC